MSYFKIIPVLLVATFLPFNSLYATELEKELNSLKEQMQEMQQNMQKMQEKIVSLEKKNKELQESTSDSMKTEFSENKETVVTEKTGGQTFIDKTFRALNPDISVIGIFAAAYYSKDYPVTFAEADPENTGINLQEIELSLQANVDPYFRFDSYFSISEEGIEIEEAFGTTIFDLPLNSQIRAGKMRAKFGRINTQHRHFQNFATLPIVASRFLGEHLNPVAVEANFILPMPWFSELSLLAGSPEVETATFDRDPDANNIGRLLYNIHLSNFIEVSESLGILIGGSYATGSNGLYEGSRSHLLGADLYVKFRPLKDNPYQELRWQTEFMYRIADADEGELNDYGFYSEVVYKLSKRWGIGARYGWVDTDDIIEMIEHEDEDARSLLQLANEEEEDEHGHEEDSLGLLGEEYRISGMLTFAPTEFSLIRLQYDYLDQDFASDQHALFLQFQYAIGKHGAHKF